MSAVNNSTIQKLAGGLKPLNIMSVSEDMPPVFTYSAPVSPGRISPGRLSTTPVEGRKKHAPTPPGALASPNREKYRKHSPLPPGGLAPPSEDGQYNQRSPTSPNPVFTFTVMDYDSEKPVTVQPRTNRKVRGH